VNGRWERVVEEKNNSTRLIFLMLAAVAAMDVSTGGGETVVPDFSALHNPVWISNDNLRAPSVLKAEDGYHLFYSRVSAGSGGRGNPTNWHVAEVVTTDFLTFTNDHRVCLKNHEGWGIKPVSGGEFVASRYKSKPRHQTRWFRNHAPVAADASTSRRCVPRPSGGAIL
jgi:hypothetical protein